MIDVRAWGHWGDGRGVPGRKHHSAQAVVINAAPRTDIPKVTLDAASRCWLARTQRVNPNVMTRNGGSLDGGKGRSRDTSPHLAAPHTATAEVRNCTADSVVGHGNTFMAALFTTTIIDDTITYAAPTAYVDHTIEVVV